MRWFRVFVISPDQYSATSRGRRQIAEPRKSCVFVSFVIVFMSLNSILGTTIGIRALGWVLREKICSLWKLGLIKVVQINFLIIGGDSPRCQESNATNGSKNGRETRSQERSKVSPIFCSSLQIWTWRRRSIVNLSQNQAGFHHFRPFRTQPCPLFLLIKLVSYSYCLI